MSEDTTTQAVVDEAKVTAEPVTAATNAREDGDDLDKLLSEFDSAAPETPKPEPKAEGADDLKVVAEQLKGWMGEQQRAQFKQDMDKTMKSVRGDLDPEFFDDSFVKAWIDVEATNDPRLSKAWVNRHSNPKQFERVVDLLGRKFSKKYGKLPDKGATEDREAVTAAVRGASTKAPEGKAPDFAGMNNAEYREAHKKEYGYYPAV